MYDWDAFLFTDSHEIEMVYSYCHSARTDPFRHCFGVKVDKKCLYETPTMQKALGENDGGVVFEQRRRLSEQLLLKNNRDMGPGPLWSMEEHAAATVFKEITADSKAKASKAKVVIIKACVWSVESW